MKTLNTLSLPYRNKSINVSIWNILNGKYGKHLVIIFTDLQPFEI